MSFLFVFLMWFFWLGKLTSQEFINHTLEDVRSDNSVLFLIDVWSSHWDKWWLKEALPHIEKNIVPLRDIFIRSKVPIYHFSHGKPLHPKVVPKEYFEHFIGKYGGYKPSLLRSLISMNIRYIFFAGYMTNICVLNRPGGIKSMADSGFQVILVRDATLGYVYGQKNSADVIKKITNESIIFVERNYGSTITIQALYNHFLSFSVIW